MDKNIAEGKPSIACLHIGYFHCSCSLSPNNSSFLLISNLHDLLYTSAQCGFCYFCAISNFCKCVDVLPHACCTLKFHKPK